MIRKQSIGFTIIACLLLSISCFPKKDDTVKTSNLKPDYNADSSFTSLPLTDGKVSVKNILEALYRRDSTSIISDFGQIFLNPDLFYYTPIDSLPISSVADTVYISILWSNGDHRGSVDANIWNAKKEIYVCARCKDYNYEHHTNLRDWEKALIEDWDTDSINKLTNPTFYQIFNTSYPQYHVFQIIINHGKAKSRYINHPYLYIPNEYKDDPIRNKEKYTWRFCSA